MPILERHPRPAESATLGTDCHLTAAICVLIASELDTDPVKVLTASELDTDPVKAMRPMCQGKKLRSLVL